MTDGPNFAGIAAAMGEKARARALCALMAGKALTATELANVADVTKQTMSVHLGKLLDSGLVSVVSQGRHRYFRIASPEVAQLVDAGLIRTTLDQRLGSINAANLKRAHALIESGKARGKLVLEGWN